MTAENATALDMPECPSCHRFGGSACSVDARGTPPAGSLRCFACGHEWPGTPAELEQARAADLAWEAVQAREEREAAAHA